MLRTRQPFWYFLVLSLTLGLTSAAAGAGGQAAAIVPLELGETPNLTALGERVYFAGQPAAADFAAFAARGVKTVVNLRTAAEMAELGFDESATVAGAGMRYVNVEIGRDQPSAETVAELMALLDDESSYPLLLHCASANRVGYVWSMFRATHGGVGAAEAIAEGQAAGLRNPTLEERARAYIAGGRQ